MRLSEYASTQRTYGSRKVPRSVQQSIPIDRIYEDGTWCCGNVYSQMWSMPDINFTMSDEDNKAKILNLLGKVYMGVPSDCWLKICIVSQRMDEKSFRENVLLHRNLDGLDKWRVERNRRIRQCVQDAGNVVQHKYLILSTNKQNVTDARSRLRQVQGNLLAELSNLGCTIKPMTNNERLEVLHNFFRRGEEGRFQFSFDDYRKLGNDFRNTIAPDAMRFTTQHAEIDDGFAKAMAIAQYPQQLSDNFVATLLQQVPYIVLSIDITPVETEDAMREIEASQMKIDSEKYRANRRNVENLDFMATISPHNQQQEKYTAEIRNAICDGDQQVFMVLLSVAFFADTPDELRQETDALQSAAANFNCRFTEMRFQQENCFNTAMPYGLRRVESSHMMLTRSVTALVPFVAQEVKSPQGIFYGRNAITGNLIVGDRTKLINGNAMVIATSGSGKSTLLNMIGGLDVPTSGKVIVDGRELSTLKDEQLTIFRRRKIGFIFQNYNLVPVLNVYENIVLPVELDGNKVDKKFMKEVVQMLGLEDKLNNMPNNLSGGQQQRVAIARALVSKPAIVLADEPTGNLDSKTSSDVLGLLKVTSQKFQQTLVMITHNNEIAQLADRIIRIEDGKIVQ